MISVANSQGLTRGLRVSGFNLRAPRVRRCNLNQTAAVWKKNIIWLFGRDFRGPKCSKIQIFRGSAPAPPGELTALPQTL